MAQFVNGPINYVELKGFVGNVKKSFVFFMDTHNELDNQTRCDTFDSVDIAQYLYKIIKETKIPLDFFMEIRQNELNKPMGNKKSIYIREVEEMFKSVFVMKKQTDRNIVKYAKTNHNVRLHYLDIRDNFDMFKVMKIIKKIKLILKSLVNTEKIKTKHKDKIFEYLNQVKLLVDNFKVNKSHVIKNANEYNKLKQPTQYYLNKIFNQVKNPELKKNIFMFLTNYSNELELIFDKLIEELESHIKNITSDNIDKITNSVEFLFELVIDLYSMFTDGFLLRRILDKDYVGNSIIYSGSQHAINCIWFLVKFAGFKITSVYKNELNNIDALTEKIKQASQPYYIYQHLYQKTKFYVQCIQYSPYALNMLPYTCK